MTSTVKTMLERLTVRSNNRRCSRIKSVLKNFEKFSGRHQCRCLFFNKVARLKSSTLLKNRQRHRYFHLILAKFLRTLVTEHPRVGNCFFTIYSTQFTSMVSFCTS